MSSEDLAIYLAQVSTRMRMIRRSQDVTQAEAAETCEISTRGYKAIELGEKAPPLDVLLRFCAGFNVEMSDLLLGGRNETDAVTSEAIEVLAHGILTVLCTPPDAEILEKRVKLVRYAFENAAAKRTSFDEELRAVTALMM